MSLNTEFSISIAHEQILVQNLLIKHDIGRILGKDIFGVIPRFTVLEQIEILSVSTDSTIYLAEAHYNSDLGSFSSLVRYHKFSSESECHQYLLLNNWLKSRFANSSTIKVLRVLASDELYTISQGVKNQEADFFPLSLLQKAGIAGEILATYHSFEIQSANSTQYSLQLYKTISSLPLSDIRKEKLLSAGITLFSSINFFSSGVYGFGSFTVDKILYDSMKQKYLVDPDSVHYTKSVDRFEDISTFFVLTALEEFLKFNHFKDTLLAIRSFLRSYNRFLRPHSTSLENIYKTDNIYSITYFHLGYKALELLVNKLNDNYSHNQTIERVKAYSTLEICKFINNVWTKGVKLLPVNSFPPEFQNKRVNDLGITVSWATIGNSYYRSLEKDTHFSLIFNRPKNATKIPLKEALAYWSIKDKKTLRKSVKDLNLWFPENVVTIDKDTIIFNEDLLKSINIILNLHNLEINSKRLREIYHKKPENKIIHELIIHESISKIDIQNKLETKHSVVDKALKSLLKENKIIRVKNVYSLSDKWEIPLDLLTRESVSFY